MHRLLAIAFLAGLLILSSKLDAAPDSSASPSKARPASSSDEPDEEARTDWEKTEKLAMDVRAYGEISDGLKRRFLAGDKDGLRAFIADPKNLRLHKALAGSYLAQLGEIEGLSQLSDLSRFAPQHRALVREGLRSLTRTTEGEVREHAEALLARTAPQPSFKPNLTALNALHSNQPAPAPPMPGFALRRLFEYGLPQGVERWSAVAFSPDGAEVVACADRTVRGESSVRDHAPNRIVVYSAAGLQELRTLATLATPAVAIGFADDGRTVVAMLKDGTLPRWDRVTGKSLGETSGVDSSIAFASFLPGGKEVAYLEDDAMVTLDALTSKPVRGPGGLNDLIRPFAISPDGRWVLSRGDVRHQGPSGWETRLWDFQARKLVGALHDVCAGSGFAFASSSRALVRCVDSLQLVEIPSGRVLQTIEGSARTEFVNGHEGQTALSPDGRTLVLTGDDELERWDLTKGTRLPPLVAHSGAVVALANGGDLVLSADQQGSLFLWDSKSGLRRLDSPRGRVTALAVSADGKRVAAARDSFFLDVYDLPGATPRRWESGHLARIDALAFSPDGARLASGGHDEAIRLWDPADGRLIAQVRGHLGAVLALAFSPDGRRLASGGFDRAVRQWDAATGKQLGERGGHAAPVLTVAFSRDGLRLASAAEDGSLLVTETKTGKPWSWRAPRRQRPLRLAAFSSDLRLAFQADDDKILEVFDLASQKVTAREDLSDGESLGARAKLQRPRSGELSDEKSWRARMRLQRLSRRATSGFLPSAIAVRPSGLVLGTVAGAVLVFESESPPSAGQPLPPAGPWPAPLPRPARTRFDARSGLELVEIPGGSCRLGCAMEDPSCSPYWRDTAFSEVFEEPHQVRLKSFWISRTETTEAAWDRCVAARACHEPAAKCRRGGPSEPIVCVTPSEAQTFCAWIGGRLPTADEWQFAARDGDSNRGYPWGSGVPATTRLANFTPSGYERDCGWQISWDCPVRSGEGPAPVGSFPAGMTPHGLHDMLGNVAEWTNTPEGPIAMGGSWASHELVVVQLESLLDLDGKVEAAPASPEIGFRCVVPVTGVRGPKPKPSRL